MDKLSDYFAILRLIESARQGGNPKAGQLSRNLDPSIYNQGLNTGMLSGSDGTGGGGSLPSEVINFVPQNKRNPKRAGMEYMSDGGEAEKEYVYGVGPEGSGIGQLLSPLLPVRREVIEPYQETFSDSYVGPDGQVYVDRTVTPGQYGEAEFAVPQAVQAFMNFKGLVRDPEAREAVLRGIAALPEIAAELPRRYQISAQAALEGKEKVYDPQTGSVVDSSEALLTAPLLTAPGTALSMARAGDASGTVLGIMGGSKAKGPVGEAAKEAKEMFNDGRRETAVYRKTGAIRTTENKPGVFIDPVGEGGLDTSNFEELIDRTGGVHGSMTVLKFTDFVDFPNVLEAYPELKNSRIEFLDIDSPLWKNTTSPILATLPETLPNVYATADGTVKSVREGDPEVDRVLKDFSSPTFYVKTRFNIRDNTHTPRIYTNPKAAFALAIQDYISQKEGFVRPKSLNPLEQQSESARDAINRAFALKARLERPEDYSGPRQMLSPMDEYRLAQLRYPATIEEGTTSELAERREDAMRYDNLFDDADEYKRDVIKAYGIQELDKYPIYFGDLMGDLGRPPKFTIEYQSPLFDIVENLPQEKGTGNQFLAAIKKAGAKQEDLLYSGLEVFLTNNKSVTKSEIRDRLYEREVPVYEKFLVDEEGKNNFYGTSYTTGSSNDDFELAPEAQLRDPRSLALITQTDPLTGVAADGSTVGLHDRLPENTFAHMRFNTRTIRVNGKPVEVLFIDEIQSDWHQRANKEIRELLKLEAPNAQGKKSGKIIGGSALEELALEKLVQEHQSAFLDEAAEIMHKVLKEDESFISAADAPLYEISAEELKRTFRSDGRPKSYFPRNLSDAYFLKLKEKYDISDAEIRAYAKKKVYGQFLPDAAFKDNWHELSFRRLVREAVEEGLDGVAFTPDYLQEARYGGRTFKFYNNVLAPYVKKYAKRNGTTLETAGLRFASDEAMEAAGYSSDLPVYYMPLSDEIKKMYRKPIPTYAMGGGVASMAPVATNMFQGYDDARRGVGAYAPLIRRA